MIPYPFNVIFASYGNDSLALIQWAAENGLRNVFTVYSDTGWAAPWWAKRIERAEEWVRSLGFFPARTESIGLEQLVKDKKGWPRQGFQFCTVELKIKPALRWLDEHDPLGIATCIVGIRRAESRARTNFERYTPISPNHGDRACFAPLVEYSVEQRNELLHRAGYGPLPHRSMECSPCINANRADFQHLSEDRIKEVERIEGELGYTSKGKPRTMFRPYRHMGATGIREVVRWANSPRGKFDLDDGTGYDCEGGFCGL